MDGQKAGRKIQKEIKTARKQEKTKKNKKKKERRKKGQTVHMVTVLTLHKNGIISLKWSIQTSLFRSVPQNHNYLSTNKYSNVASGIFYSKIIHFMPHLLHCDEKDYGRHNKSLLSLLESRHNCIQHKLQLQETLPVATQYLCVFV